jgi:hypothetical protein
LEWQVLGLTHSWCQGIFFFEIWGWACKKVEPGCLLAGCLNSTGDRRVSLSWLGRLLNAHTTLWHSPLCGCSYSLLPQCVPSYFSSLLGPMWSATCPH